MKRLLSLLLCLAALPLAAQLKGFAKPGRPVTALHCAKSGSSDVVLTWTCDRTENVQFIICRGILQPEFRAEKIVATVSASPWTDTGALTRTIQGAFAWEFYRVYAVPVAAPKPLQARSWQPEYRSSTVRNAQHIVRLDISNGGQFAHYANVTVLDDAASQAVQGAQSSATAALVDLYNRPEPSNPAGRPLWANGGISEQYPSTVDHAGLFAGVRATAGAGDETLPATTARTIPVPAITGRAGQVVSLAWTAPAEDSEGVVTGYQVWRGYQGTGDAEPQVLVANVPASTLSATDDITAVTANWYCFYTIRLVFADGHTSPPGSGSAPVRR
jgi:hypothetical protein